MQHPNDPSRPGGPDPDPPIEDLEAAAKRLKEKIAEERRRHDMPLNSTLGDPNWDERAKDGRFDRPDDDDD